MSTESGIPDWHKAEKVRADNHAAKKPDPERMALSYQALLADPEKWWQERLAKPSKSMSLRDEAEPNSGHYALTELERLELIACIITSNVDGLHEKASSRCLIEFHGSHSKLRCISCGSRFRYDPSYLKYLNSANKFPPRCLKCNGVLKPDGVSFGEPIPVDVQQKSQWLVRMCDLMLVCGTTASVYPFGELPNIAETWGAKIIEINDEPTRLTEENISKYLIRGKTGEILPAIVDEVRKLVAKDRCKSKQNKKASKIFEKFSNNQV